MGMVERIFTFSTTWEQKNVHTVYVKQDCVCVPVSPSLCLHVSPSLCVPVSPLLCVPVFYICINQKLLPKLLDPPDYKQSSPFGVWGKQLPSHIWFWISTNRHSCPTPWQLFLNYLHALWACTMNGMLLISDEVHKYKRDWRSLSLNIYGKQF